jgi:hypothetical protein
VNRRRFLSLLGLLPAALALQWDEPKRVVKVNVDGATTPAQARQLGRGLARVVAPSPLTPDEARDIGRGLRLQADILDSLRAEALRTGAKTL